MVHGLRMIATDLRVRRCPGFRYRLAMALGIAVFAGGITFAQQVNPSLYSGMRWRLIGPHRGGRVTAVAGIPGDPAVYYMGTPGGGVWKTTDGGRVWKPIFDQVHVASIGALALAPSNPQIIYVGTGEQTEGNGVYRSTDGGATWTNVGLRDAHLISSVLVDPRDPDVVLIGAIGEPDFGVSTPNSARGVFKSTDGGKSWNRALYKDDATGVADLCFDPGDPRTVYAALWRGTFATPTEEKRGGFSGIYKSSDEGSTWKPISGHGLPTEGMGRIGIAVAPGNHGRRVYAIMNQGFFRSDDAGASWQRITTDPRIEGNSYFSRVFVDPRNADIVFVAQTSLYRSTDGGQTFAAYKGAPGGDDHHVVWIDPENSQRMILGADQGATVSLDGGRTWSSWFNQATGQFYHVSTDNQFPYHAYAEQQDSGTAAVPNRSDYGEITFRDWFSVGGFEDGYVAADPTDPNTVFTQGWYGTIVRFDKTTGQISFVFVPSKKYRVAYAAPILFSPQDAHTLYLGTQYVLKTTDRGMTWQTISPDLTQKAGQVSEEKDDEEGRSSLRHRTITTLALSPVQAGEIWVGTGNGVIQLSRDGGASWQEVTPSGLPARSELNIVEASRHDGATAYAAVMVSEDSRPYIYRTADFGKSWQKIVEGIADSGIARVVREDPVRKGLLYAGTETGVYVSFDNGEHWQTLQLNLPTSPVRDLAVHGDDLVAATYGRALWILDDLTPLRQVDAEVGASEAFLFRPATAVRARWDNDQETPLPPEVSAGENPPEGAIIDYYLKSEAAGDITLAIYDEQGNLVRRFSNVPAPADPMPKNVPDYWFGPPEALSKSPGMNRFAWDLTYPAPPTLPYSYYGNRLDYVEYTLVDHAIAGHTPRHEPWGPLVAPGKYEVELTVEGKTYRQQLTVEPDPRVHVAQSDYVEQADLAKKITKWMSASYDSFHDVVALRAALTDRQKSLAGRAEAKEARDALSEREKEAAPFEDGTESSPGFGPVNRELSRLITMVEDSDMALSTTLREAVELQCETLKKDASLWRKLNSQSLPPLNQLLSQFEVAPVPIAAVPATDFSCSEEK